MNVVHVTGGIAVPLDKKPDIPGSKSSTGLEYLPDFTKGMQNHKSVSVAIFTLFCKGLSTMQRTLKKVLFVTLTVIIAPSFDMAIAMCMHWLLLQQLVSSAPSL